MQPGQGCTVFYAASGDQAFAGNNEDSYNPLTRLWFASVVALIILTLLVFVVLKRRAWKINLIRIDSEK
jgi:hypothetical protein